MKDGTLYINYRKDATPIADHLQEEVILKNYKLVDGTTQIKQLDTPNILTFYAVESLCKDGKIKARKIVYMMEGVESEMQYKIRANSKFELPSGYSLKFEDANFFTKFLKNVVGF